MGLPDPRKQPTLPILRRVQAGIKRRRVQEGLQQQRIRLPLTVTMLERIHVALNECIRELVWAVASVDFFGFFHLGELLLDSGSAYTQSTHSSWGDAATNSCEAPTSLQIHLRQCKCDQFGKGVDVLLGGSGTNYMYALWQQC